MVDLLLWLCKLFGVQNAQKQKSFLAEVATSLILWQTQRCHSSLSDISPSPPLPKWVGVPDDVRTDQVAHWPVKCDECGCYKLQNQCSHHSVRNVMCIFASLRNETVSSLTIWLRLKDWRYLTDQRNIKIFQTWCWLYKGLQYFIFFCTICVFMYVVQFSVPMIACCECPQIGSVIYFNAVGIFCDAKQRILC